MSKGGRGDLKTYKWTQLRKVILERDRHECQIAGPRCTGTATQVDHIVPHAYGGDSSMDNLRAACKPCNSAAGARLRTGRFLDTPPRPLPPTALSLAEPLGTPQRRRTHRQVPE